MGKRFLRLATVAVLAAFAAACGSSTPAPEPTLTTIQGRTRIDGWNAIAAVLQIIGVTEGAPPLDQFLGPVAPTADSDTTFYTRAIGWLAGRLWNGYEVEAVEIGYDGRALDAMGLPMTRRLSGAVFMPDPRGKARSVPIVVYTHGTELKRSLVASRGLVESGYDPSLGGAEGLIGAAFASAAPAIVLMPDYQGMGSDNSATYYHPYVHRDSLAWASVDMVKGVLERIDLAGSDLLPKGLSWNGKLYVIGYSEGGFAAMAFTREWEVQGGATAMGFPLDCSAPLAGPHNLSGQMVPVMTNASDDFGAPFFLPYVLYAYERIYPAVVHPDEALRPDYVDRKLRDMMSGAFTGSYVDDFIWSIGGKPMKARSLLVEDWVKANLDVPSPVTEVIAANNTVAQQGTDGAWVNSMPVYMIHSRGDRLVPYGNSQDAKGWLVGGNGAPVSLRTVSPHGWNPDHGPAAPFALVGGIYWLANGCKE